MLLTDPISFIIISVLLSDHLLSLLLPLPPPLSAFSPLIAKSPASPINESWGFVGGGFGGFGGGGGGFFFFGFFLGGVTGRIVPGCYL